MKTTIEWIPVERELPPDDTNDLYLIASTYQDEVELSWYAEFDGMPCWNVLFRTGPAFPRTITHWAHLPTHPKQLEDNK